MRCYFICIRLAKINYIKCCQEYGEMETRIDVCGCVKCQKYFERNVTICIKGESMDNLE